MEIGVLGPVQVVADDGSPVAVRSRHRRMLLAVLVAARGRPCTVAELAEALWPHDLPDEPEAALQSHVSRLRRALGPGRTWIETAAGGYRLAGGPDRLDRDRFEHLLRPPGAVAEDPLAALDRLDRALALWRGAAFGELADRPAVMPEAARLDELRVATAEERAQCLLRLGRAAEAAHAMRAVAAEHPYRERPVATLVRALAADGRHADALRELERFRRLLDDELGLVPSPELRGIGDAVLHHRIRAGPAPAVGLPGNSFVGRDAVVARVAGLLEDARVVSLTGPGGVGKTRLALHVADAVRSRYPDGVHLCELAGVADPADVTAAVGSALRVEDRADRALLDRVVEVLGPARALLLLDNCEHVRSAAGDLVAAVVRATTGVDVLITTRERLGVEGEHRVTIEPLATPAGDEPDGPAVRLFLDRLASLRPDATLGSSDLAAAAALCRLLDGLPLAIELAAAQSVWRSPREVLVAVSDRLQQLSDERRAVARHRSLQAVFDWSSDLLAPGEREVLERLAVFVGGWTESAAGAVADAAGDVLGSLVESSLVTTAAGARGTRYSMLEPVRQYAEVGLRANGADAAVRARHAAWAADLVERADAGLRGPDEVEWRAVADAELANLRAALRWSVDHDWDTAVRLAASLYRRTWCGAPSEVYSWAEQVVSRRPQADHPRMADAYATAAVGAWHRGDLVQALALAESGTRLADRHAGSSALAWEALGDVQTFLGNFEGAVATFNQAVDRARAAGDEHQQAIALLDRALCHAYMGRVDAAAADCEAAAPLVARAANPSLAAWCDYANGEIRLEVEPRAALLHLRRSVATARRIGNRLITGVAGLSAVSCEARVGAPARALAQYGELIRHWRHEGAWTMQWTTLRTLVGLLARLGRDRDAAVLYGAMLASTTAGPLVGADAARMAGTVAALTRRLGPPGFDEACALGAGLSDGDAVAFALDCAAGRPGTIREP